MKVVAIFSFVISLFSACTCSMEAFVVGGSYTSITDYPHSVYLECSCPKGEIAICSASVINQRILLTAAHCLIDCKGNWKVNAFAGSSHIQKMPYIRRVAKYIIHHKFSKETMVHDIALAYLQKVLPLGDTVKRVILKETLPDVSEVHVAGWGIIDEKTEEESLKLKAVKQRLLSKNVCNEVAEGSRAICAQDSTINRPSSGDSGSALITNYGQQIGLVSFRNDDRPELTIYTDVSHYYKWIEVNTPLLYCSGYTCSMEAFVVGGSYASIKKFPHSVFLECFCDNVEATCGSSVINQRILLTAAHCLADCVGKWNVTAFAGSEHIKKMPYVRIVSKYVIHKDYRMETYVHDIALAYLKKGLPLGSTVKRVILKNSLPNIKDAQVAGWGIVDDDKETVSFKLKAVKQKLQSRKLCVEISEGSRAICGKDNVANRPSRGDSGSALVTNRGQQIGLVSFRNDNRPEIIIYTDVTHYYQWIQVNAVRLYCRGK